MKPKLEVLPKAQLKLWPLLSTIPSEFTLYGGTAVALQLGHRESVDFDFFSAKPLQRDKLIIALPFLNKSRLVQPEINTLDCYCETEYGGVKLQFLAGLDTRQGRVDDPLQCEDNGLRMASLRDLLASKLNTIQVRAEIKDYLDIDAMLSSGLSLSEGLGCACAVWGSLFDPGTSIRALCSYRDGNLSQLPKNIQDRLVKSTLEVNEIPVVTVKSATI